MARVKGALPYVLGAAYWAATALVVVRLIGGI